MSMHGDSGLSTRWVPMALCALFLALAAGVYAFGNATGQPAGKPFRLATVTLKTLLENLEENKALDASLAKLKDDSKAELDALKKKVDAKQDEIEAIREKLNDPKVKKNPDEFVKLNLELREMSITARGRQESLEAAVDIRTGGNLKKIYEKILGAVQSIAQQDGYDMVIVDDTGIAVPEVGGVKEISSPILSRQILYRDANIDITQAVLTKMNSDYKSGRK